MTLPVVHIKDWLQTLGVDWRTIPLGDFDTIGHHTALRTRSSGEENYHRFGATYKSNYERGITLYHLIRRLGARSMLEIGSGRFYSSICAAKAFADSGAVGKIVTVDRNHDAAFVQHLGQTFDQQLLSQIHLATGNSVDVLPQITEDFDIVLIDGDHSKEGTMSDWLLSKDRVKMAVIFDDYHLPSKVDPGIQCAAAIDEIDFSTEGYDPPVVIRADRRLFADERGYDDAAVNYGQCYAIKAGLLK